MHTIHAHPFQFKMYPLLKFSQIVESLYLSSSGGDNFNMENTTSSDSDEEYIPKFESVSDDKMMTNYIQVNAQHCENKHSLCELQSKKETTVA